MAHLQKQGGAYVLLFTSAFGAFGSSGLSSMKHGELIMAVIATSSKNPRARQQYHICEDICKDYRHGKYSDA